MLSSNDKEHLMLLYNQFLKLNELVNKLALENDYESIENLLKDKDESLTGEDVKEGLTMIVSCKHPNPQFEGQTKGRLGNSEVRKLADGIFSEGFEKFLLELK